MPGGAAEPSCRRMTEAADVIAGGKYEVMRSGRLIPFMSVSGTERLAGGPELEEVSEA